MIEFDNILNEVNRMTRPQWVQLMLLTLPCILAAMHMGAMVYIGAEQPHMCTMPMKDLLVESCGANWTEEQTKKYFPLNKEKNGLDACRRYTFADINCSYWWPNMTFDTNQSSLTWSPSLSGIEQCYSWTFNTSIFENTVVNEFNLVCESSYQRRLAQAVFMLGVMLGCSVWGQVSDSFGRKLGILGPLIVGFAFAISTAFVPTFYLFTCLRFFVGFCIFPAFSSGFVLGTETVKPKYRVWVGQSAQAIFAVGFCLLALLGFYIRDWRTLQITITAPILVVILILCKVPDKGSEVIPMNQETEFPAITSNQNRRFLFESPRWLISTKKYLVAHQIVSRIINSRNDVKSDEANKLEKLAMKKNGTRKNGGGEEIDVLKDKEEKNEKSEEDSMKTYSISRVLLKLPNMRRKSLIMFYIWMAVSCMYYGLTLNAADLGGDPFINLFLSGLVEIPASYLAIVLLEKWGRRPTLVFTLMFGGTACICMMFIPKDLLWLNITLSMSGKFASAAAFGTVYIYATEIYPTPVRNAGLGLCSSWARVGGILAPFIAMLDTVALPLPYVVFGLLSIVGGFLALLLPEVLGIKLPETLEEGEAFGKEQESTLTRICRRKRQKTSIHEEKKEYAKIMNGSSSGKTETSAMTDSPMKV